MEKATGINWEIQNTTCVSEINMQLSGNREYQTECTLVIGQSYILECISNDGGWNSNHLIIENVAYCEYAKAKTIINIIFNGNVNNLCTFLISSKSDIRFWSMYLLLSSFIHIIGEAPQQCPTDFPFAFSYGKACCAYEFDSQQTIIKIGSETCFLDRYRPCVKDRCVDNSM